MTQEGGGKDPSVQEHPGLHQESTEGVKAPCPLRDNVQFTSRTSR